ncbi:MAG: hypothetical protein SGBAC_006373 [Bacillariaceae sp.]
MSAYVDPMRSSVDHCNAMASQFPDLAEKYYNVFSNCSQQKLWHQLTLSMMEFYAVEGNNRPIPAGGSTFLALYKEVVQAVDAKLNQLSVAQIAASVAFSGLSKEEGTTLLDEMIETQKENIGPKLYLESKRSLLLLNNSPDKDALATIYSMIKTNKEMLDQLIQDSPDAMIVNRAHYEMTMSYYKIVGPPEDFYEEAIRYLNYHTPEDKAENKAKSHQLAVDICLSALTGEGVYNLGQVVSNPMLLALKDTPDAWLMELLEACGKGQVAEFKQLVSQKYPSQIASQPALVNMGQQMQEKMTLLALVKMIFERPSSERTVNFSTIAQVLEIPLEQVEWVIMRAFSVKLMEGSMDQVDGIVHVTWILPRVLDNGQMSDLASRFGEWAGKVAKTKDSMQADGGALTQ